ncbi:cyclic peptide export ABC transporter [Pseudoalteromonas sp. MMG013]|uniref:cyclic peptide export ABC transporter n=1 Tax=Pseudoalteromonas sp. MMG013 TaxID=2822687 RepID=UPI001B392991|nr:cyclic peptide export ABC transporter [Pseudoalteromonas sp. MMG013]MBQ4862203.1 cyclic peptide export ABC transporter [Pseudoalteromonas sp. MMG013]
MKLFSIFTNYAPNRVFLSMLLGGLAGASYALLIPLVLTTLEAESTLLQSAESDIDMFFGLEVSNYPIAQLFFCISLFILISRSLSQVILSRISMDITSNLRQKVYQRIINAPLNNVESIGEARLIATLTTDVPRIVQGARVIPDILISGVTMIGMLAFLLYLSNNAFVFVIKCIFFGAITYQIPVLIGKRYFDRSRKCVDNLQKSMHGLIFGIKELKLNKAKREAFLNEELLKWEKDVVALDKKANTALKLAANYGDLISFFVIGAVSFIFINYHTISTQELIGVIMALLYIAGPIGLLLNLLPQITLAGVSIRKVEKLLKDIPLENANPHVQALANWHDISFKGVCYEHANSSFALGPVDFSIKKGEITFIVGGNGSGKSTLSKLITHHYLPSNGSVYFGETQINLENMNSARQYITAIYSDYFLFERLYGIKDKEAEEKVNNYLKLFDLEGKVEFKNGVFSTLSLSDGQKRRLALIVAYLDDTDLYLFDEWAADQDPHYKDVFYKQLLPELKEKGKAIVAITHDDRYYSYCDQLIIMEEGSISKIERSHNLSTKKYA